MQCPWVCARLYMLIVPVAQFVTGALVIASDDEDEGPLSDQEAERRTKAAEEFNKGTGEWPSLLFPAYAWSLSHCVLLSHRYRRIFPDSTWRWSPYSGAARNGWYWTALVWRWSGHITKSTISARPASALLQLDQQQHETSCILKLLAT